MLNWGLLCLDKRTIINYIVYHFDMLSNSNGEFYSATAFTKLITINVLCVNLACLITPVEITSMTTNYLQNDKMRFIMSAWSWHVNNYNWDLDNYNFKMRHNIVYMTGIFNIHNGDRVSCNDKMRHNMLRVTSVC